MPTLARTVSFLLAVALIQASLARGEAGSPGPITVVETPALPPAMVIGFVGGVVIRVEEFPDEETEREMDLESPFDLLGLYRGVALPHKSSMASASHRSSAVR